MTEKALVHLRRIYTPLFLKVGVLAQCTCLRIYRWIRANILRKTFLICDAFLPPFFLSSAFWLSAPACVSIAGLEPILGFHSREKAEI